MFSPGCCGPSELQAQLPDLAHQCSRHTSHSKCVITRYICNCCIPATACWCDCVACVCRNFFDKAGKQQLAEGFCSEHIWTHPCFEGKPAHLTMIKSLSKLTWPVLQVGRCSVQAFMPLLSKGAKDGSHPRYFQGTSVNTFCIIAVSVHHLSHAGLFSFVLIFPAATP